MARTQYKLVHMERKGNRSTIYIGRTSLHGCLLGLLSSVFTLSLAQNHCGHISNIPADHVRRGKGWMLSVDAVAVADGENPLSARPDQGSPPFSLTKPVRLPSSIAHCRDVGSCLLPPPSSRLSYVPTSLRYNSLYSRLAPLLQLPTSLHVDISLLLCPARTSTGFYCICDEFMSHQLVPVILF